MLVVPKHWTAVTDSNPYIVMCEIRIEGLVERKVRCVVVNGGVDGRVGRGDELVLQTSQQLLDIADTLSTTGWIPKRKVVKILYIKSVLKPVPLVLCEKGAKVGHANVACLVRTDALHGISVVGIESEAGWSISLHPSGGISQVQRDILE